MNDLVSRQALLDTFGQWQKTEDYSNDEWNLLVDVLNVIKSMPPEPQLSTNLAEVGTDCISRRAAIDALKDWYDGMIISSFRGIEKVIDALPPVQPTIQPEPHWIPVEQDLPKEPFGCLVTVWDTDPVTMEEFENILPYFVGWDGEQWNDADGEQCPFEVIAWWGLPEPYKEVTE